MQTTATQEIVKLSLATKIRIVILTFAIRSTMFVGPAGQTQTVLQTPNAHGKLVSLYKMCSHEKVEMP